MTETSEEIVPVYGDHVHLLEHEHGGHPMAYSADRSDYKGNIKIDPADIAKYRRNDEMPYTPGYAGPSIEHYSINLRDPKTLSLHSTYNSDYRRRPGAGPAHPEMVETT